jgi:hypothetical protein
VSISHISESSIACSAYGLQRHSIHHRLAFFK